MLRSSDGLFRVEQAVSLSETVFPPAAWSIINLPVDTDEAKALFKSLHNSPTSRHISLVLCRQRRKDRLVACSNLGQAAQWNYLDTVSIWYEKPSTCSNNGLLPIAEPGVLLYKGPSPDASRTAWFSDGPNASNLWNVATQKNESDGPSYYQRFSWEVNMLLMSMATPLEHAVFIYGLPLTDNDKKPLFGFCRHYRVAAQVYTKTHAEAKSLMQEYEIYREVSENEERQAAARS